MKNSDKIHIATIGKCVGLYGDLKLHLFTDFREQFTSKKRFKIDTEEELTILSYDSKRSLVRFEGYADRNSASTLTNKKLYSTMEKSLKECELKEGEYFWFELIGVSVEEDGLKLGTVEEIQRIADTDYLVVKSDKNLIEKDLAKSFFIPYIPTYIDRFEKDKRVIYTKNAYDILEAS